MPQIPLSQPSSDPPATFEDDTQNMHSALPGGALAAREDTANAHSAAVFPARARSPPRRCRTPGCEELTGHGDDGEGADGSRALRGGCG